MLAYRGASAALGPADTLAGGPPDRFQVAPFIISRGDQSARDQATGRQLSFVCDGSRSGDRRGAQTGACWKVTLVKVTALGDHVIYRWPGQAGTPQALKARYKGDELDY